MRHLKWLLLVCIPVALAAQPLRTVKARLAPVPIDFAMQATVAGSGTVTATLAGTKLSISGAFDGLKSPATIAQVHNSPAHALPRPLHFHFAVTKTNAAP